MVEYVREVTAKKYCKYDCLVSLVVKVSASRAEDPEFPACTLAIFPDRVTSDLKIGTPIATLPGHWDWLA